MASVGMPVVMPRTLLPHPGSIDRGSTDLRSPMHTPTPVQLFLRLLLLIALARNASQARTQKHAELFDSLYGNDYSYILTGRFYLSTKDNAFALRSRGGRDLVYRPNNQINWGLGASYRAITLNIGIRIPLINDNDAIYGNTRYFDA
jgi:hypothetical protein